MTPKRFALIQQILNQRQPDLTVVADGVHKPHNVSAILRTCDAVGVRRLYAVAAEGSLDRHHMIAGGSKRWVDLIVRPQIEDAYSELRTQGFEIVAAHGKPGALDFREFDFTRKVALVLGAELTGPSQAAIEGADHCVQIPMHGMVESLNVSVAAAVILYEAQRQKAAAGHYQQRKIAEPEYSTTLFEWSHPDIAKRCRDAGLDYPSMTAEGDLAENPFIARSD